MSSRDISLNEAHETVTPAWASGCVDRVARRAFLAVLGQTAFAVLALPDRGTLINGFVPGTVEPERRKGATVSYSIPGQDGAQIDRKEQVILVRHAGKVFAFSLACLHQNTALRWAPREQQFQCPRHKSRYQPDGTFTSGRATRSMDRFAVRLVESEVEVSLDHLFRQDEDPAGWNAAFVTL